MRMSNSIVIHTWTEVERKNDQNSWLTIARRSFLNTDYLHPDYTRDIDRDSQVTESFSYRSIASWTTISRIREIRESLERG
jgi:hypothetical protein